MMLFNEKVPRAHLPRWLGIALTFTLLCSVSDAEMSTFDDDFLSFLEKYNYTAGSVGVMRGEKLIYTKGFSLDDNPRTGNPLSLSPVSSFSKLLTSVAILLLVESGQLKLNQTVFCKDGILGDVHPWESDHVLDSRVCNITVDHLLHHTAGWDSRKPPMFDPLLNQFYLAIGQKVPDIAAEIGATTPYHIMRYMLSRNLDFTPGTKAVYSNFGYSILGRVIVQVTGTSYTNYVKRSILNGCGMWHTRLLRQRPDWLDTDPHTIMHSRLYESLGPNILDAALGWQSNIFDILRFVRCVNSPASSHILSDDSIQELTRKPEGLVMSTGKKWFGAGIQVNNGGEVWVQGDHHSNGLIVFNSGTFIRQRDQISWVIMLTGKQHKSLRDESHKLMETVGKWPDQDLFATDLTDFRYEPQFPLIKVKLSEHHIKPFINALKFQKQRIVWFSGHVTNRTTQFTVIASQAVNKAESNYIFESGLTREMMPKYLKRHRRHGYMLSFFQSYQSRSHDPVELYACLFEPMSHGHRLKVGLKATHVEYKHKYSKGIRTGFMPTVQTVTTTGGMFYVSYILSRKTEKNFKGYIGVKLEDLERIVHSNAGAKRGLSYLDVTTLHDRASFSAVFKETSLPSLWAFYTNLSERHLHKTVIDLREKGLHPRIMVGLPTQSRTTLYVAYFG